MIDPIRINVPRLLHHHDSTDSRDVGLLDKGFVTKKLWIFENKNVEFCVNGLKDYLVIIKQDGQEVLISKERIYGVPAKALEDPVLDLFLKNAYVKIRYDSSGKAVSASINQRGKGGIDPGTAFLVGCAIIGGAIIISGIISYFRQRKTDETNLKIARIQKNADKKRQEAAIKVAEIERQGTQEIAAANRYSAQQRARARSGISSPDGEGSDVAANTSNDSQPLLASNTPTSDRKKKEKVRSD